MILLNIIDNVGELYLSLILLDPDKTFEVFDTTSLTLSVLSLLMAFFTSVHNFFIQQLYQWC